MNISSKYLKFGDTRLKIAEESWEHVTEEKIRVDWNVNSPEAVVQKIFIFDFLDVFFLI